jgi:uncharacterized protein (DUF169 family)
MENDAVFRMSKALRLERQIVGLRFLAYRQELETSAFSPLAHKRTFCGMAHAASQGEIFTARGEDFGCPAGALALGVAEENEVSRSGRGFCSSGLYGSFAAARQAKDSMRYINHRMYGIELGPLAKMDAADTVIIIGNARQMMRIMQGYAHQFGAPKNLCAIGNQAMCSDLVSKPFNNNDINLTLMCKGARENTKCGDGDMGAGFPAQMFHAIAEGVLATMNLVETNAEKQRILDGLETPMALGIGVEMNQSYGVNIDRYNRRCAKMEAN